MNRQKLSNSHILNMISVNDDFAITAAKLFIFTINLRTKLTKYAAFDTLVDSCAALCAMSGIVEDFHLLFLLLCWCLREDWLRWFANLSSHLNFCSDCCRWRSMRFL